MLPLAFPKRVKTYLSQIGYFLSLKDNEFIDRFRLSKEIVLFVVDKI